MYFNCTTFPGIISLLFLNLKSWKMFLFCFIHDSGLSCKIIKFIESMKIIDLWSKMLNHSVLTKQENCSYRIWCLHQCFWHSINIVCQFVFQYWLSSNYIKLTYIKNNYFLFVYLVFRGLHSLQVILCTSLIANLWLLRFIFKRLPPLQR